MATATRRPPTSGGAPPPAPAPPSRRAIPAGHVVLVALVAVVVGSFLNAQGLRKIAYTQPEGWRRDVGMAFTRPLVDIASILQLDRPREGLKSVLGREDDDVIVTSIELPPETPGGTVAAGDDEPGATVGGAVTADDAGASSGAEEEPEPKPVFTPQEPMRLWIAGDSLSIVPGEALLRLVGPNGPVRPVSEVEGRLATGLERPDRYDWFTRIKKEMAQRDPDAVVLTFGANDFGGYMTGLPDGVPKTAFGSPTWMQEYRRRVAGVMDLVTGGSERRFLVWIGVPIVNDEDHNERYKTLNAIVRAEAERRPGRVAFVDTYRMFRSKDGGFVQRMKDADGKLVEVRSPDGLHFEPAGGDRVAAVVLKRIEEVYDLREGTAPTGTGDTGSTGPADDADATSGPGSPPRSSP